MKLSSILPKALVILALQACGSAPNPTVSAIATTSSSAPEWRPIYRCTEGGRYQLIIDENASNPEEIQLVVHGPDKLGLLRHFYNTGLPGQVFDTRLVVGQTIFQNNTSFFRSALSRDKVLNPSILRSNLYVRTNNGNADLHWSRQTDSIPSSIASNWVFHSCSAF